MARPPVSVLFGPPLRRYALMMLGCSSPVRSPPSGLSRKVDVSRSRLAPFALFAVALQLVLLLPVSPGLVLCVGTDGHVAVESGRCADESPEISGDCQEFGTSTPCTDTPLAASELLSSAGPRAGLSDGALAIAPAFASPRFVVAQGCAHDRTATFSRRVTEQRSSVLRL